MSFRLWNIVLRLLKKCLNLGLTTFCQQYLHSHSLLTILILIFCLCKISFRFYMFSKCLPSVYSQSTYFLEITSVCRTSLVIPFRKRSFSFQITNILIVHLVGAGVLFLGVITYAVLITFLTIRLKSVLCSSWILVSFRLVLSTISVVVMTVCEFPCVQLWACVPWFSDLSNIYVMGIWMCETTLILRSEKVLYLH